MLQILPTSFFNRLGTNRITFSFFFSPGTPVLVINGAPGVLKQNVRLIRFVLLLFQSTQPFALVGQKTVLF